MSINWNMYLSRYQQTRGGLFFGALEDEYDCHLVLTEGEETPLLVWIDTDPGDGCYEQNILARAMVKLDGVYDLHIHPRTFMGGRLMGMASLVRGGLDYEYSEATKNRIITCTDGDFCRRVLDDEGVRFGLSTWKQVYLKIRPTHKKASGWHVVELTDINFEGSPVHGSHWICASTLNALRTKSEEDYNAASEHFNARMDMFLDFIRAACRAAGAHK